MTPSEQEILNSAFINQIQDALELIDRIRPQLKKLAKHNPRKSVLKMTDFDIPELLSESIGISGILHLAMGTYAAQDLLSLQPAER